jgi:hypothetical protein
MLDIAANLIPHATCCSLVAICRCRGVDFFALSEIDNANALI